MKEFKSLFCLVLLIWLDKCDANDVPEVDPSSIPAIITQPAIPRRFTATIMMVVRSRHNQVIMAKEYFDASNNKSAMFLDMPIDLHTRVILDFGQQKIVEISDGSCDVKEMKNRDTMFFVTRNGTHMASANQVFQLMGAEEDHKPGEVNGIAVRTWNSTHYFPSMEAYVTVEASFAAKNWTFPHCFRHGSCHQWSRPVLLKVSGTSKYQDTGLHEVNIDYYFLDFIDDVDPEAFVPPVGVYCNGYTQPKDADGVFLLGEFSLESEVSSHVPLKGNSKQRIKVYYEAISYVLRVDVTTLVVNGEENYSDEVFIMDGRNGIQYIFDGSTGKFVKSQDFFDLGKPVEIVDGEDDSHLSVISITNIVFGDRNMSSFDYIGQRTCRLGKCDVWIKFDKDKDMLTEIYVVNGKANNGESIYTPVEKRSTHVKDDMDFNLDHDRSNQNFFNYQPIAPDWSYYDITGCYEEQYLLRFQVLLKGPYSKITSLSRFRQAFQSSINQFAGLLSMRTHKYLFDNIYDEHVTVTATLVEDPKLAGKIGTNEDTVEQISNNEAYNNIEKQIVKGDFTVMYMTDEGKPVFYTGVSIRKDVISEDKINENALIMKQFVKTPEQDVSPNVPPATSVSRIPVDECAHLCNKEASFQCESFTYCRSTGTCKMFMKRKDEIESKDFVSTSDCNLYARNYSYDFSVWEKIKLRSLTGEPTLQNQTVNDCLRSCVLQENKFVCSSVDICKVKGANEFSCFLHNRHFLEVPMREVIEDPKCLHFSRQYVTEFQVMVNASIENDQFVSVPLLVNVQACAMACATDPEGCTDFEMCKTPPPEGCTDPKMCNNVEKTDCSLMRPRDGATISKVNIQKNTNCDHYHYNGVKEPVPLYPPVSAQAVSKSVAADSYINNLRQDAQAYAATDATTTTTASSAVSQDDGDGYSPGEMAGLAVGTLVLGGLLGAATFYFVARRSVTSGQDQGIVMKLIGRQSQI